MAEQQMSTGAGAAVTSQGAQAFQGFNLQQFGAEVAGEIGVDPNNLGAYGLSEQTIQKYESELHSSNRRSRGGGSR